MSEIGAIATRKIGIGVAHVVADWGLGRYGAEDVRAAVEAVLDSRPGSLVRALESVKAAGEVPRAGLCVLLPTRRAMARLEAGGLAAAFSLSVRRQAVLVELRWAAFAVTVMELRGHLDHAATRLGECIDEEDRAA
jgi:hypothetical protein